MGETGQIPHLPHDLEPGTPQQLTVGQANLMASVAQGVFKGDLPWTYIFIGMGIAAAVISLDEYLKRIGSTFRTPVLAVTIGIYLPLELAVPIFAGGIIHWAIKGFHKRQNTPSEQIERSNRSGLLFASGLITGEALMGIVLAIPIILGAGLLPLAEIFRAQAVGAQLPPLIVGFLAAAISGYVCIRFFLSYLQQGRLYVFAIYCWLGGIMSLTIFLIRG